MTITKQTYTSKAVGGLVGGSDGAITIQESYYNGNIEVYSQGGGLIGQCGHNLTIENCWTAGSLTNGDGYYGALFGYSSGSSTTVKISNCYSTMSVSNTNQGGQNAIGGLIGGSSTAGNTWNVSGLLAWNNSISIKTSTATEGVIIGQIHPSGGTGTTSFTDCWYRYDLSYTKATTARTPASVASCTEPNTQRFDGQKADSGVTCSAKATELGWGSITNSDSQLVWNLDSGDYPTLKNLPE